MYTSTGIQRTDLACAQTSKNTRPYLKLIPLRPRCRDATLPKVPVVVVLALKELSPGTPHNNTIYVAAVRPTGCCSQDIWEDNIAKIMQVIQTKSVAVA